MSRLSQMSVLFRDGLQFCSGLVDLVVRVCRHFGGGHHFALAGELLQRRGHDSVALPFPRVSFAEITMTAGIDDDDVDDVVFGSLSTARNRELAMRTKTVKTFVLTVSRTLR
jgi:hypothetical protein